MSNAVYTDKYRERWNLCRSLFIRENIEQDEERRLSDKYSVRITEYAGKVGYCNLCGCECRLVDSNKKIIAKWFSIDNDSDFYKIIKHSNGKEYLIFRQDLYGYSVLDIGSGAVMQFFPEAPLMGHESFIWTDIEYNSITNILAVSGCYWSCPFSTHLFSFEDPMSEQPIFIDFSGCFPGHYDIYQDIDFIKWENGDLHISRFIVEKTAKELTVVKPNEYLKWLSEKGREL